MVGVLWMSNVFPGNRSCLLVWFLWLDFAVVVCVVFWEIRPSVGNWEQKSAWNGDTCFLISSKASTGTHNARPYYLMETWLSTIMEVPVLWHIGMRREWRTRTTGDSRRYCTFTYTWWLPSLMLNRNRVWNLIFLSEKPLKWLSLKGSRERRAVIY